MQTHTDCAHTPATVSESVTVTVLLWGYQWPTEHAQTHTYTNTHKQPPIHTHTHDPEGSPVTVMYSQSLMGADFAFSLPAIIPPQPLSFTVLYLFAPSFLISSTHLPLILHLPPFTSSYPPASSTSPSPLIHIILLSKTPQSFFPRHRQLYC